ncbi:unnamed protein product [Darwinula stevensoni]|uniref:Uncharacterized protein n=1 Tax=Darwinula stevensoni TaxID=69355 RepID=A0A7R9A3U9_9CRUS|nr:unnamed protein product [Darwinula stevensoni]CAG0882079.1 unnamed protein product [Darwinula stevensoni]
MKTVAVLVFLSFGGLASASLFPKFIKPRPRDPTQCNGADLNEIVNQFTTEIIPFEELKRLTLEWFDTDPEMRKLYAWVSSMEVKEGVYDALHAFPPFVIFLDILRDGNIDIDAFDQELFDILGWSEVQRQMFDYPDFNYINDLYNGTVEVDSDIILTWLLMCIQFNTPFRELFVYIQSDAFYEIVRFIWFNVIIDDLIKELENQGFDVEGDLGLVAGFLGWPWPPTSIRS